jgi:hypothetical protein
LNAIYARCLIPLLTVFHALFIFHQSHHSVLWFPLKSAANLPVTTSRKKMCTLPRCMFLPSLSPLSLFSHSLLNINELNQQQQPSHLPTPTFAPQRMSQLVLLLDECRCFFYSHTQNICPIIMNEWMDDVFIITYLFLNSSGGGFDRWIRVDQGGY